MWMRNANLKFMWLLSVFFLAFSCSSSGGRFNSPSDSGMDPKRLSQLDVIMKEALAKKYFPGAVILVGRKDKIVFRKAYGDSQWVPERKSMTVSTIFDQSSITKPMATAPSVMILAERGLLSLEDRVIKYVPEFSVYTDENGKPGENARLWHLLTHTSGLPPYTDDPDAKDVEKIYGNPCSTELLVRHIAGMKKTDPPGQAFHYSCLGYITLAHIIKMVSGQTVADFAGDNIFKPLKMKHTFYTPNDKFKKLCAPTEMIDGQLLQGVVHDPLARLQGGISGNAGLFSTADDMAVFARMMLNKGEYKGTRILSPLTVERMTTVFPKAAFAGRGLGWDLDSAYATNSGEIYGPASYGHSGYTGTSIWIDPETSTYVIFNTNRVHPDDRDDQGAVLSWRARVANFVASSILKK